MEGTKALEVVVSRQFNIDLYEVFEYGAETFGLTQAKIYESEIWRLIEGLSTNYLLFPECRYITTKSKMYRWIILDSHLLIYRVTKTKVQVLRLIHAKRSITKVKTVRKIRF